MPGSRSSDLIRHVDAAVVVAVQGIWTRRARAPHKQTFESADHAVDLAPLPIHNCEHGQTYLHHDHLPPSPRWSAAGSSGSETPTAKPKASAAVEMPAKAEARAAIHKLDLNALNGRFVTVNEARR